MLFHGDITTLDVDALVCPNNAELWTATGVTGAIIRTGGEAILRDAVQQSPAQLGSCVVTRAVTLSARFVFHVITAAAHLGGGPVSPEVILTAIGECFRAAELRGLKSIAFPALGAGGGGLPFEASADLLVPAIVERLQKSPTVEKVVLALYGPGAFHAFNARLEALS